MNLSLTSAIVLATASILIVAIWVFKAKTCYFYYYFSFNPEQDIPTKVAWLVTIIIAGVSVILIW